MKQSNNNQSAVSQSEVFTYRKNYPELIGGTIIYGIGLYLWSRTKRPYSYADGFEKFITILLIVLGLAIVYYMSRRIIEIKKYYNYHHIIYQEEIYRTNEIAEYCKKDSDEVRDDLETLIKRGYFKYIRVNKETDALDGAYIKEQLKKIQRSVVRCQGCGAPTKVVEHEFTQCEYCGRKLTFSEFKEKN